MPELFPWAYHDGGIVPLSQAHVPLTTQALQYGTGVFEGIRAYAQDGGGLALFRAREHYERMLASCRALRIDIGKTAQELCQITVDLLALDSGCPDSYVRPLAYKLRLLPGTPPGVQLSGVSDALSISVFRMGSYGDLRGIHCAVSPWRRPPDNVIPVRAKVTGGYVNSALALDDARRAGYGDAILLTTDGRVAEATTSNVFAVRRGVLRTPPVSTGLLEGVTRDTVLTLAAEELGVECLVADLAPDDLLAADEVFLTGTGCEIVPVTGIAGLPVAAGTPGRLTRLLADRYAAVVRGRADSRADWLTPVCAAAPVG